MHWKTNTPRSVSMSGMSNVRVGVGGGDFELLDFQLRLGYVVESGLDLLKDGFALLDHILELLSRFLVVLFEFLQG